MDDIKARIRKLLALGQSPNEHEAAIAMTKAAELMMRHNLTEQDVTERKVGYGDSIDTNQKRYRQIVANAIAHVCGCVAVYRSRDQRLFQFVGKEMNVVTAQAMYAFIVDQLEGLYKQFLPKGMSKRERGEYRKQFKLTCSIRIAHRLFAIDAQVNPAGAEAGKNALVVRRDQDREDANAALGDSVGEFRQPVPAIRIGRGAIEGVMAGDTVQLQKTMK